MPVFKYNAVEAERLLNEAKPLRDPVLFLYRTVMWLMAIIHGCGIIALAFSPRRDYAAILAVAVFGASIILAVWLLLRPTAEMPVLFLRAFQSDQSAVKLRRLLQAALGPSFRLCGIRAPRARSHILLRFFASGLSALRSVGSPLFDLEAEDHNWMARLTATYTRARLVFIDVRSLTSHVETEVCLSLAAMGDARCIFVVDENRSLEEWPVVIRQILGRRPEPARPLHLLDYPGDDLVDEARLVAAVRAFLEGVPGGPAGISAAAVNFAREHVSEIDWKTPFAETDLGLFILGAVVTGAISALCSFFPRGSTALNQGAIAVSGLLFLAFYFAAFGRSWQQAHYQARYRLRWSQFPHWRLVFSLLSLLLYGAGTVSLFTAAAKTREMASRSRALQEIRDIATSLRNYNADYGKYPDLVGAAPMEAGVSPVDTVGAPEDGTPDNSSVILALCAIDHGLNENHWLNPRRKVFLEGRTFQPGAPDRGGIISQYALHGGSYLDPWGRQYRIKITQTFEPTTITPYGGDIRDEVLVWSLGPDGHLGTAQNPGDDIVSWE